MIGAVFDRFNELFERRLLTRPGWVVLAEVFLGVGWLRAAIAKVISSDWWSGTTIVDFVHDYETETITWYRPIIDQLILDQSTLWAAVVVVLELLIAATLLTSWRIGLGLGAAIFLNINFLLVGSPNPSVFYLVLQLGLVLWAFETSVNRAASLRWLRALTVAGGLLAILCLPYTGTMDPQDVIDDPALVLAMLGISSAVAASVARRRVRREKLRLDLVTA